ncbi:MAG: hypothetical protein ABI775_12455 [Pseudonocardiales bacterium]
MSKSALAILLIATLVWFGVWLSVRAAGLAEIQLLPAHCRRRVQWWQSNARSVQIACVVAAAAAACLQVGSSVG